MTKTADEAWEQSGAKRRKRDGSPGPMTRMTRDLSGPAGRLAAHAGPPGQAMFQCTSRTAGRAKPSVDGSRPAAQERYDNYFLDSPEWRAARS
jgi:hypothetical protein